MLVVLAAIASAHTAWAGAARLRPPPLVFIYGAQDADAIRKLPRLGANAVHLEVAETADLDEVARLVDVAGQQGLKVILGIATTPGFPNAPSVTSSRYREWASGLISRVVTRFQKDSRIVAWATGDFLEQVIEHGPTDYEPYLKRRYGDLAVVNETWGSKFGAWSEVTQTAVTALDASLPYGVGVASVDIADCRLQAIHDVMQSWARRVRALDVSRPLMTGRISLYYALAAVPAEYDVVCPAFPPEPEGGDALTHNVHAVGMARRGGRYAVIPCLDIPLDQGSFARGDLRRWIALAALHGACGIGLADWDTVQGSVAPSAVLRDLGRCLEALRTDRLFTCQPRPSFALLYEPYAAGAEAQGQPAYGLIGGFSPGEPSNPLAAFRLGTRFGLADYLTLDDLLTTDLSAYGALFAPLPLRLPGPVQAQLEQYVRAGGALVCDLGSGMYETGSWLQLPPALGTLLGVRRLSDMEDVTRDLSVGWCPPYLPSLQSGARTRGAYWPPASGASLESLRAYHVSGPACYATPASDARAIAVLNSKFVEKQRVICGLIGKETGLGVTCFATHRLWANWLSSDPVYVAFHHDLCARRARLEMLDVPFWTEGVAATAMPDGVAVLNARREAVTASVVSYDAGHALHTDAICTFSALARRPDGTRSGAVRLAADIAPESLLVCKKTPMLVQPVTGTCTARLLEQSASRLVIEAAGEGAEMTRSQKGVVGLGGGTPTEIRFTIGPGVYATPDGSRHRVCVDLGRGRSVAGTLTASGQTGFRFSETIGHAVVTITPLAPN